MKRKVEVSLLGQSFTVRSDKDEAHVHALANFVTRRFETLQHKTRTVGTHELALLVALNLAEELFEAEERAKEVREVIRGRAERVLASLNGALDLVGHPDDVPASDDDDAPAMAPAAAEQSAR